MREQIPVTPETADTMPGPSYDQLAAELSRAYPEAEQAKERSKRYLDAVLGTGPVACSSVSYLAPTPPQTLYEQ